jgi:Dual-action HEIGH metallo-peptidase
MKKTIKSSILFSAFLTLFLILPFSACIKDLNTENIETNIQKPLDDANKELISCLGFKSTNASSFGEYAHIEDNILISKETLKELANAKENTETNVLQTRQFVTGALVNMDKVNKVKVYIDAQITNSSNTDWYKAIVQALVDWNNVTNFRVKFSLTTSITTSNLTILLRSSLLPPQPNRHRRQK